jgi:4-amino-4-deoxy-L-arabinose transferase-like glycosyltransferase
VIFFQGLGASPLLEPDEGRYAEIPREMLASGDWLVPAVDGLAYVQKPPLAYWLTGAAYRALGVAPRSARVVPALAAVATIALTAWFGAHAFGGPTGLAAAAILATTPLFFVIGRLAILDMPLTLWLTLACIALHRAAEDGARRWRLVAGLAIAAAVMTKGLVGIVLPLGIAVASALVERDGRAVRRVLGPWTVLPAVVLSAPWFVAVARRLPGFVEFFFVRHHLVRYAVGGKIGHAHHAWYLPLVFVAGALPWSLVRLAAAFAERPAAWLAPGRRAERYCDVWMVTVVAFFTASRLSLATYLCPAFPPLALGVARAWTRGGARRTPILVWGELAGAVLVLAVLPVGAYAALAGRLVYGRWWTEALALRPALALGAAAVVAGALVACRARTPAVALAAIAVSLAIALVRVERTRAVFPSAAVLGETIRARRAEADRVVCWGRLPLGLPFYARRRIAIVAWTGADDLGGDRRRESAIRWSGRRLVRAWNGRRRIFLVIAPEDWRRLRPRLVRPASVLAFERGRALVTNAPLGARPTQVLRPKRSTAAA